MPNKKGTLWHKIKKLEEKEPQDSLRCHVLDYIQNHYDDDEDIKNFFNNLCSHGCVSGMICHLIYYADTHRFFDTYYDDIEELREETEDCLGEPLAPKGDLKNWFAWFGFEETAYRIASELNL